MTHQQMFDGEGKPIEGPHQHGENAYSRDGEEYKFSDRGEGWMPRREFQKRYEGGLPMFE